MSVGWLAGGLGALLLLFLSLNAFNLKFLFPRSTGQLFLFTGLSVLVFLLLLMLLVLLFRNILKLYADERSRVLGSRIRTRMLLGALLLSFAPAFFLFLFSYLLMNRTIDRWFTQPVSQLRDDSTHVALQLTQYAMANARAEAASLAASPSIQKSLAKHDYIAINAAIAEHRITLEGGFVFVYQGATLRASFHAPDEKAGPIETWNAEASADPDGDGSAEGQRVLSPLSAVALETSRKSDEPILSVGNDDYVLAAAPVANGFTIVCGFPMPDGFRQTVSGIRGGARDYWTLRRARNKIRGLYLLVIFLLTALVFFTSSWLALFLSKGITRPVEALADAMDAIAKGHYGHRIPAGTVKELGELVRSFNAMAADLERTRELADSSTAQLSDANRALQERRRELETILQTIPTGVIILNDELRMQQSNQAATELLAPDSGTEGSVTEDEGQPPLEMLFPSDQRDDLWRMIRRCQRIGVAAGDFEFRNTGQAVHLTVTVALLEVEQQRRGYIMVLEDVTESLRAQRQVAWKEAAQRVAHEIKNPLTPIALSAGRIQRHLERGAPESPAIIRRCSEVILNSVETMRTLVDEFAALAQFPVPQIRPVDLNAVVQAAIDSFSGRLERIQVVQRLTSESVLVAADAAGLMRAMVNLIDNAAEAMQDSLLRELTIETNILRDVMMAEIVVSDTGQGLTDEARERLFLPYFSTKQRGTGLGLAITAKIVQEHNGFIRAEQNHPAGARFILELPLAGNASGGIASDDAALRDMEADRPAAAPTNAEAGRVLL
jgi:two-component system nitrogen regulation sensor histidine kinase NtrY